jgi:hypothetical protein
MHEAALMRSRIAPKQGQCYAAGFLGGPCYAANSGSRKLVQVKNAGSTMTAGEKKHTPKEEEKEETKC